MSKIGSAPYHHGIAMLEGLRVLVDTAGTALCITQQMAEELELTVHEWLDDRGTPVAVVDPPELRVGDAALDTEGLVAYAFEDTRPLGLAARDADVLLPAAVLRRHHVVLDDPAGRITVGPPGSLERRGVAVPASVDVESGLVTTTLEVDGAAFDVVVDSAITASLAVDGRMRAWQAAHADWPASASSVGPGNMTGIAVEARVPMLRVEELRWGPFVVPQVAFAWRGQHDVVAEGALGGNVLRLFRVDIDYAARSVRVEQGAPFPDNDAELVGVVLALGDEGWEVAAAVSGLEVVRPGDVLESVAGHAVDLPLPEVLDLLRGTPGDRHRLTLRRDGETLEVHAPVLRLL
jgi:hypothetical protein